MNSPILSIIILTYNTKDITIDAIRSIEDNYPKEVKGGEYQVIVCDNASTDGSLEALNEYKNTSSIKLLHIVDNGGNLGFSAGNNKGVPYAQGKYVLFLNPDTIVYKNTLNYMLDFMEKNPNVGASSCKLINKEGLIDFNCHRGFPTPWNAFCYFSGLQKLFPRSRIFAGYTQGWKDLDTNHAVDAIEGAFMLMPRKIGEDVGWWDEDYFFYGEDLQFCYDIQRKGRSVFYIGEVNIMHIGGAASGIKRQSQDITTANLETKKRLQKERFKAMRIFYRKNYKDKYPFFLYWLVLFGIKTVENKALAGVKVS
jgi:GT2 family glycosyltransferase